MISFRQLRSKYVVEEAPLVELFDSMYEFQTPKNFKADEVFYSIKAEGYDIKVQLLSDFGDPVIEDNNLIKIAFGRPVKKPKGWIKVETEELLSLKNPTKLLSTVFNGVLAHFIQKYFEKDPEKKLTINFHGALTDEESNKGVELSDSKRARIYTSILKRMPILKKYKLEVYNVGEEGIDITNDKEF